MLVDDHSKVLEELKEAAVAKKLIVPSGLEEEQATILKSLSILSGTDFDNAFKDAIITTHENAIKLFQHASNTLNDAELRTWADQKVPSLKSHLEQAKALQVGAASDTASPSIQ